MTALEDAVRDFGRLSRADVAYAGGKGANLGELTAAGLPVPPGFVIGAPAYAAFCDQGGLRDRIEERLSGVDVEDTGELERAAEEVRADDREGAGARVALRGDPRCIRPAGRGRPADRGRGALLGDGRGHRVGLVRRDERDAAQRPRGGRRPRRGAPLLVLAVRRPHGLLPGETGLRPSRHGHRRRRPAPDRGDAGRRHVHDRPRLGCHRSARHRGRLRPRRVGRLRRGLPGSLRGRQGQADDQGPRGAPQGAGDRVGPGRRHDHPRARRARGGAAGAERRRGAGGSPSWACGSRPTTAPRRTPSGRSTARARSGCSSRVR